MTLNARGRFEALDEELRERGFGPGVCRSGSKSLHMWWWGRLGGRDATLRIESTGTGWETDTLGPEQWAGYVFELGLETPVAVRLRLPEARWARSIWASFARGRGYVFLRPLTGIEGRVVQTTHETWAERMAASERAVGALRELLEGEPRGDGPSQWPEEPTVSMGPTPKGGAFVYRSRRLPGRALGPDLLVDLARRMSAFLEVVEELPEPERPARPSVLSWIESRAHVLTRVRNVVFVALSVLAVVAIVYMLAIQMLFEGMTR